MLEQITPLILTWNEAPNIGRTLEQLKWARDIVVVDSFSTDATLEIAASFSQVRVFQREFDSHRNQWEYGLRETGINSDWVLALDADYILTNEAADEIKKLAPEASIAGYQASFVYCVNGRKLQSGIYPPVVVLYRREAAVYVQDGHTQRVHVRGRIDDLHAPLLHDDRKSLNRWLHSQARYAELEARKLIASDGKALTFIDRLRRWPFVAPPLTLLYCLIVRGGVLDGWAGFYYALQRTLAELMLSLYLLESRCSFSESTRITATRQRQLSKTAD